MKNVKDMSYSELRMYVMPTMSLGWKLGARTAEYEAARNRIADAVFVLDDVQSVIKADHMFPYTATPAEQAEINKAQKAIMDALYQLNLARRSLDRASDITRYEFTEKEMELSKALKEE